MLFNLLCPLCGRQVVACLTSNHHVCSVWGKASHPTEGPAMSEREQMELLVCPLSTTYMELTCKSLWRSVIEQSQARITGKGGEISTQEERWSTCLTGEDGKDGLPWAFALLRGLLELAIGRPAFVLVFLVSALIAIVECHPMSTVAAIFIIIAVPTHRDLHGLLAGAISQSRSRCNGYRNLSPAPAFHLHIILPYFSMALWSLEVGEWVGCGSLTEVEASS